MTPSPDPSRSERGSPPGVAALDAGATPLGELARLFLKLGTIAFGGPAAHIAMMEDEVVRRRRWLTREQFLDYLGATNLIPGPNSTELAIHVGHARAGWRGLLVAGACFILPAALIVAAIAWAYVKYGTLPQGEAILRGVKPVVIAVVFQAMWRLGRSAVKSPTLAAVALTATVAAALGAPFGLLPLFAVFAKIGAVLFGSGYVLLVFLRADLVERLHWLSEQQLLDAVAVGQLTPGPVFTTATFVGYVLGGGPGAAVATLGIFLPAFVFVALSGPLIPRLRRSPTAGAVLDGVNVASLALMVVVTWHLARSALVDGGTVTLALLSAVLLLWRRVNSAWLVLGGAMAGLLLSR